MSTYLLPFLLVVLAVCGPATPTQTAETDSEATHMASTTSPTTTEAPAPPPLVCPEQATNEATGDTTNPEVCPDHPATDACCCFLDITDQGMSPFGTVSVCGAPVLCPTIILTCTDTAPNCASEDMTVADPGTIACSLQALADGKKGRISWKIENAGNGTNEHVELDVLGDGTVFRQGGYLIDLCFEIYPVERLPLPDPAYLSACLTAPDWQTHFDCIRQALTCTPSETCRSGYSHTPSPLASPRDHDDQRLGVHSPKNGC